MPINQTSVWNGSQWVTMGGVVDTASNYNWAGSHNFSQSAIFQDDVRVKSLNSGHIGGFRNKLINGNMDIYQRGSFSSSSGGYALDRWHIVSSGSASATTVTQQTAGVPVGSRYCMRIAMGASGGYGNMYQYLETSTVSSIVGQTVTLSAKFRRNSGFTPFLTMVIEKSATVDAGPGATWSVISSTNIYNINMPTGTTSSDWYTASLTAAIPNDGTANSIRVYVAASVVTSGAGYYETTQWQLESGTVVTPFEYRPIGTELLLCQRYYWRNIHWGTGTTYGNNFYVSVMHPVTMRSAPTISKYANGDALGLASISTITVNDNAQNGFNYMFAYTGSNFLATRCFLYLEASAEL
jgi:hypothetical protein